MRASMYNDGVGVAHRDSVAPGPVSRLFEFDLSRFKHDFLQTLQLKCIKVFIAKL
jgi:hypothetical protein